MRRLLLAALVASFPAAAQTLTPGGPADTFQVTTYVSGLGQLTDFRFLPDGRVVMTEKTGAVKVRRTDGTVVTAGSFTVDSSSEKGLLGVEVDPQFATNTFLYFYASDGPSTANKHRVLRVALSPSNALACTGSCSTAQASVLVLLQNLQGPANHDGGGLAIGPDGKLYVGVGDTGCNSGLPPGPGNVTNWIGTCLTTAQRQGAPHQPRRDDSHRQSARRTRDHRAGMQWLLRQRPRRGHAHPESHGPRSGPGASATRSASRSTRSTGLLWVGRRRRGQLRGDQPGAEGPALRVAVAGGHLRLSR